MDMKEFRESTKAAIVRDQEWLKKIESILQKVSRQNPANKKIIGPLRELKRTVLNEIKVYEKFLKK
jgi:hypothetical protein